MERQSQYNQRLRQGSQEQKFAIQEVFAAFHQLRKFCQQTKQSAKLQKLLFNKQKQEKFLGKSQKIFYNCKDCGVKFQDPNALGGHMAGKHRLKKNKKLKKKEKKQQDQIIIQNSQISQNPQTLKQQQCQRYLQNSLNDIFLPFEIQEMKSKSKHQKSQNQQQHFQK